MIEVIVGLRSWIASWPRTFCQYITDQILPSSQFLADAFIHLAFIIEAKLRDAQSASTARCLNILPF